MQSQLDCFGKRVSNADCAMWPWNAFPVGCAGCIICNEKSLFNRFPWALKIKCDSFDWPKFSASASVLQPLHPGLVPRNVGRGYEAFCASCTHSRLRAGRPRSLGSILVGAKRFFWTVLSAVSSVESQCGVISQNITAAAREPQTPQESFLCFRNIQGGSGAHSASYTKGTKGLLPQG
jgi:hypothetical protein